MATSVDPNGRTPSPKKTRGRPLNATDEQWRHDLRRYRMYRSLLRGSAFKEKPLTIAEVATVMHLGQTHRYGFWLGPFGKAAPPVPPRFAALERAPTVLEARRDAEAAFRRATAEAGQVAARVAARQITREESAPSVERWHVARQNITFAIAREICRLYDRAERKQLEKWDENLCKELDEFEYVHLGSEAITRRRPLPELRSR